MGCISVPTALIAGSAVSAGASLFGGLNASNAATDAARIQAAAADRATALQQTNFDTTQANLAPFRVAGQNALTSLSEVVGSGGTSNPIGGVLTAPIGTTSGIEISFSPTSRQLASTPGYQFVLGQGRQAVANQLAASGLAGSGAAGKAQTNYAEGLAGTTFQQQFQNWQTQQQLKLQNFLSESNLTLAQRQQIYNMLGGLATTGQNAAANAGSLGIQSAAQVGNSITGAGAATAGGIVGSANALNAGLTGVGNSASNAGLLFALNNAGMFGSSGGSAAAGSTPLFGDSNWRSGG